MAASVPQCSTRITTQTPCSKLDSVGGFSRKSSGFVHFLRPSVWKSNNAVKVSCSISKENGSAVSVADSVPTVTRSRSVFISYQAPFFCSFNFCLSLLFWPCFAHSCQDSFFFFWGGSMSVLRWLYKDVFFSVGFHLVLKRLLFSPCFVASFVGSSGFMFSVWLKMGI